MKRPRNLDRGRDFLGGTNITYLKKCHREETDPKARDRLLVYMMRKEGMSIRGIAKRTNRSYSTIRDWLVRARDVGSIRDRWDHGRSGRPCRLDASQTTELLADLAAGPENCGFETRLWTARTVCAH
ncbi:MAG: helix-turn-helix domain-containing protein, partial [Nitrosopumilus sp. (ex Thoosa mismalolli)]|nr:helix-turn-helix domain-containing protein [Nitrosopumilus sp. (ex Thoosa mismalolli)]